MSKEVQDYVDSVMSRLDHELSSLKTWFKKDFPEGRIEFHVDLDKVKHRMTLQCRCLTGKEMSDNQGSFVNLLTVREDEFLDPMYMNGFLQHLNVAYKRVISDAINSHLYMERNKEEAQRRLG